MKTKGKSHVLLAGTFTTGLVASASAATVQITLTGNMVSTAGGNQLRADITGDSIADITFANTVNRASSLYIRINGGLLFAGFSSASFGADAQFAIGGVGTATAFNRPSAQNLNYLNPITFTDSRINGGVMTNGWLQVNAFNSTRTDQTLALTRVIFDDASTTRPGFGSIPGAQTEAVLAPIPEPSGMALLALGAGGMIARRRRQQVAA